MYSKEKLNTYSKEELLKICRTNRIHLMSTDIEKSDLISNILKYFRRQSRIQYHEEEKSIANTSIMTIDQLETIPKIDNISTNIFNNNNNNGGIVNNNNTTTGTDSLLGFSSSLSNYSFQGDSSTYKPPISASIARRKTIFRNNTNLDSSQLDLSNYQNTGSLLSDDKKSIIKNILNNNKLIQSQSQSGSTFQPLQFSTSTSIFNNVNNSTINTTTTNTENITINNNNDDINNNEPKLKFSNFKPINDIVLPNNPIDISFQSPMSPSAVLSPSSQKDQDNIINQIASLDLTKISPRKIDILNEEDIINKSNTTTTTTKTTSTANIAASAEITKDNNKSPTPTTTTTTTTTSTSPSSISPNLSSTKSNGTTDRKEDFMQLKKRLSLLKLKDITSKKKAITTTTNEIRYSEVSRPTPKINPHSKSKVSNQVSKVTKKPDFDKIHQAEFDKLQSIADYQAKKQDMWAKLGFTNVPWLNKTTTPSTTTEASNTTTNTPSTTTNIADSKGSTQPEDQEMEMSIEKSPQLKSNNNNNNATTSSNNNSTLEPITPKKNNLTASGVQNPFLSSAINFSSVKTPTKFKTSLSSTLLNSPVSLSSGDYSSKTSISATTPSKLNLNKTLLNAKSNVTATPSSTSTTTITSSSSITPSNKSTITATTPSTTPSSSALFKKTSKSTATTPTSSLTSKTTTTTPSSSLTSKSAATTPTSTLSSVNMKSTLTKPTSSSASKSSTLSSTLTKTKLTTPATTTTTTPTTTTTTSTKSLPSYAQPTFASNLMNKTGSTVNTGNTTTTSRSTLSKTLTSKSSLSKTSSLKSKLPISSTSSTSSTSSVSLTSDSALTNITNTPPKEGSKDSESKIKKRKSVKSTVVISGTERRVLLQKKASEQSHELLLQKKRLELLSK